MPLRYFVLAGALAGLLGSSPLLADWVTLQSGEQLRGIGLKKLPEGYRFTLDTGEVITIPADDLSYFQKSPRAERVEFRGRSVSLREKIRILQEERRERDAELLARVEAWARQPLSPRAGSPDAGDAKEAKDAKDGRKAPLEDLDRGERIRALLVAVKKSRSVPARRGAAVWLARIDAPTAPEKQRVIPALARAVLDDADQGVRVASLGALAQLEDSSAAEAFFPALRDKSPRRRIRAAGALAALPHPRAAQELIETIRYAWAGFGRAYVHQGTQRAYIADYELVSGGTGYSVIEVADPVIRTVTTGVVLDVDVQRVEMVVRRKVLEKLTGVDLGDDAARWEKWLADREKS